MRIAPLAVIFVLGAGAGYVGSELLSPRGTRVPVAGEVVAQSPATTADISALTGSLERQLAGRRLDRPDEDNALETYRRIAALAPSAPETKRIAERLSDVFWSSGVVAMERGQWVEAARYFKILETLPGGRKSEDLPSAVGPISSEQGDNAEAVAAGVIEPTGIAIPEITEMTATLPLAGQDIPLPERNDVTREAGIIALKRGDEAKRLDDIISARRFYEFAAAAKIPGAARAAGLMYDPAFLKSGGVRGVKGNPERARAWYQKAAQQGDPLAERLLDALSSD